MPKRKNPAAVALGRRKSPRKAAMARRNGKLGGAPTREQRFVNVLEKHIEFHRNNTHGPHSIGNAAILVLTEVRDSFAEAFNLSTKSQYV